MYIHELRGAKFCCSMDSASRGIGLVHGQQRALIRNDLSDSGFADLSQLSNVNPWIVINILDYLDFLFQGQAISLLRSTGASDSRVALAELETIHVVDTTPTRLQNYGLVLYRGVNLVAFTS